MKSLASELGLSRFTPTKLRDKHRYDGPLGSNADFIVLSCGIMLYKVVLTFKSVDETLLCDHSYESY